MLDIFLRLRVEILHQVNHDEKTAASNLVSQSSSFRGPHALSFQHSVERMAFCHLLLRHFSARSGPLFFMVNDCLNWRHTTEETESPGFSGARC